MIGGLIMKKHIGIGIIAVLLFLGLTACNKKTNTENISVTKNSENEAQENDTQDTSDDKNTQNSETATSSDTSNTQQTQTEWPEEFEKWGIPIISTATVTLADNRSSSGNMLTQGVNAIVNLSNVSKTDFSNYCTELETAGFTKNPDSYQDTIIIYNKSIDEGEIELTLSFTEDTTTIIANNSAAASQKDAAAGGSVEWPEAVNSVPVFTKGKYKETIDMGGNMYTITFNEVSEEDLDWYRNELINNGFKLQTSEDTEGYMKTDANAAYSVGFVLDGNSLQIIIYFGTY